jgi:single-strand DNA-binding protein
MKKIENTFAVTGYVANDAQVNNFDTASVARFSIAVNRPEKKGGGNYLHFSFHGYRGLAQE